MGSSIQNIVSMARQSYPFLCFRYILLWLCITLIVIQLTTALNDDLNSSSNENSIEHLLARRNSRKVAQMLQQILQRGEMQVEPYRIHEVLHRLHRRQATVG